MHPTSWEKNIPHASHIYDILQTAKPPVSLGGQCTNNIILIHCQSKDNRPRQSHQLNVNPIPFERQFIVNPLPIWCKSCANLISIQCQYHINCQTDINQKPMGCQSSSPGCQFIAYPMPNHRQSMPIQQIWCHSDDNPRPIWCQSYFNPMSI